MTEFINERCRIDSCFGYCKNPTLCKNKKGTGDVKTCPQYVSGKHIDDSRRKAIRALSTCPKPRGVIHGLPRYADAKKDKPYCD